jgi:signal transduction histidine kinase/DNA-binding response OmpR family regulator/Tfp pilus assembly protein PilF
MVSFLLFLSIPQYANSTRDSLLNLLGQTDAYTEKIELLTKLHEHTSSYNAEESIDHALKMIELATLGNKAKDLCTAHQKLAISYTYLGNYKKAQETIITALDFAEANNDYNAIAICKRNLGTILWYQNNIDGAIELYREALDIFIERESEDQIPVTMANIGTAYYIKGNYSSSIEYYTSALNAVDHAAFPKETADYLNDIGVIYKEWGKLPQALQYFFKAQQINIQLNNKRSLASNLDNIGSIYLENGDHKKSLEYFTRGLEIEKDINNQYGIPYSYLSIGSAYKEMGKIDSSLYYLRKSEKIFLANNDETGLTGAYVKIGEILGIQGKYPDSKAIFEKVVDLASKAGDNRSLAYAYNGLAKDALNSNKTNIAIEYFNKSIALAEEGNYVHLLKNNFTFLSEAYTKTDNFKAANNYLSSLIAINDSIFQIEKRKQANELLVQYETDKKENEILLLNKQNRLNEQLLSRQRLITAGVIVLLILSALVLLLLVKQNREKTRVNKLLNRQKEMIEQKQQMIIEQNEKLSEQSEQLKEMDKIKNRFFTNISHEFRTPLTLIISPVDKMLESLPAKHKPVLQQIKRNANNLLLLINQLLELSRMEKGFIKMRMQKADIASESKFIASMFQSKADEKGIQIIHSECMPIEAYFDKEKFEAITGNLISNAIKHTRKGKVEITIETDKNKENLIYRVSDTGEGIPEEALPFIFDRFFKGDGNKNGYKASTGIGLAFVKELINIYKGNIHVSSKQGKGSLFTVILPLNPGIFNTNEIEIIVTPTIIKEQTVSKPSKNDSNKTQKESLLLIEDHDELRQHLASILSEKFTIMEAPDGLTGEKLALKNLPDLIVTDVMMPGIDGIELTRRLKENEETSHIPVIVLTAMASEAHRLSGLKNKADDYITKPFSNNELLARIENLLENRKQLRKKYMKSITVTPSEITTNSVDEQFIAKLLDIVESNLDNSELSVDTLCNEAGVSRATLHKKLKSLVNQSATEFINTIRVKRASMLIQQNAGSISEIAYRVGFNNLSYFTKTFKNHFGITPSQMSANGKQ